MNNQQVVELLNQVGQIAQANANILRVAKELSEADGQKLINISSKLFDACDMINQLAAEKLDNPAVNKEAVTW